MAGILVPTPVRVKPAATKAFDPVVLTRFALERLVAALGSNVTAGLLDVDRSRVSRWKAGERITPPTSDRILDLDFLLTRLLQTFHSDDAGEWLSSPSPFLHGSRPIDVLAEYGLSPVLNALAAVEQGAFA
jgi:uncharacterized protein (DUF2384 family)